MKKDLVKSIIKGKSITGDDIGRLLLADMGEEYKNFLKTGEVKSIISQEEFNKLLNSLDNNIQIERYNRYVNLHNTIKTYMSMTRGTAGEVKSRLSFIIRLLGNAKTTVQTEMAKDNTPLILTQKQYNELMEHYTDGIREESYSLLDVFMHLINTEVGNYISARENTPEETTIDTEVEDLRELYKNKPVKNRELQRLYRAMYETNEDGYFTFKDLSTGLGDTRDEFIHNLELRNVKVNKEALAKYSKRELKKPVDEVFINAVLTPEQVEDLINYHLYSTPPESIYKTDLLDTDIITENFDTDTENQEEQKELLRVFNLYCKEVPELIELVKNRAIKYKCLAHIGTVAIKDYLTEHIKGADLIRDDVPDYKSWGLYNLREDYPRAYNGIAIIKEDILNKYDKEYIIDADGNYKPEDISYFTGIEDAYLQAIMFVGNDNKNMVSSLLDNLKQVYAHNTFIDIVAEVTKLPIVKEAFKYDTDQIEAEIREYNLLLYAFLIVFLPQYARNGHYDRAKEIRENVFKAMPYIDIDKAKITPEARQEALEYISDLNNFKGISATSKPFYILTGWNN